MKDVGKSKRRSPDALPTPGLMKTDPLWQAGGTWIEMLPRNFVCEKLQQISLTKDRSSNGSIEQNAFAVQVLSL